jgi:hypothetical protein
MITNIHLRLGMALADHAKILCNERRRFFQTSRPRTHCQLARTANCGAVARLRAKPERENFFVSGVGHGDNKIIDLTIRPSSKLKDLGHLKDELRQRARAALPAMCAQLGTTLFEPSKFELELAAHGDGALTFGNLGSSIAESSVPCTTFTGVQNHSRPARCGSIHLNPPRTGAHLSTSSRPTIH